MGLVGRGGRVPLDGGAHSGLKLEDLRAVAVRWVHRLLVLDHGQWYNPVVLIQDLRPVDGKGKGDQVSRKIDGMGQSDLAPLERPPLSLCLSRKNQFSPVLCVELFKGKGQRW